MKEIVFCGVDSVPYLGEKKSIALISILDRSEEYCRPDLTGYAMSLSLDFEDTSEETKLMAPGAFGDYPSEEENLRFAQGRGERVFDATDAKRIIHFVRQAYLNPAVQTLAVHCYQGVSRSAAVAKWATGFLGVPLNSSNGTSGANPRVLRLLTKAEID